MSTRNRSCVIRELVLVDPSIPPKILTGSASINSLIKGGVLSRYAASFNTVVPPCAIKACCYRLMKSFPKAFATLDWTSCSMLLWLHVNPHNIYIYIYIYAAADNHAHNVQRHSNQSHILMATSEGRCGPASNTSHRPLGDVLPFEIHCFLWGMRRPF